MDKNNIDNIIKNILYEKFIDNITDVECDILMEKATRNQYARKKIKKEYDFKPDGNDKIKDGYESGTISIKDKNGKEIRREKVRIWNKGKKYAYSDNQIKKMKKEGKEVPDNYRISTNMETKYVLETNKKGNLENNTKSTLEIDDSVFNLKNNKRRKAIIDHEIGHKETNTKSNHLPTGKNSSDLDIFTKEMIDESIEKSGTWSDENKDMIKEVSNYLYNHYKGKENTPSNRAKLHKELLDKMKAYDINNKKLTEEDKYRRSHENSDEFEADAYSANKNGTKNLKRSIRELNKQIIKESKPYKKDKELKSEVGKELKACNDDYKTRSKVLKDKKIRELAQKTYR